MPPPTFLLVPPGFSELPTTLHWSHSSISLFTSLSTFVVANNIPRPPVGLGFGQEGEGASTVHLVLLKAMSKMLSA
jgi:hypothetical protein